MFTIAFVFNDQQAKAMAEVDVDIVCAHLGWTSGGEKGIKNRENISGNIQSCSDKIESAAAADIPEKIYKHLALYEKQIIINALEDNSWKQTQTADYLGLSRKTLYNKIKKYNIN